MTLLMNIKSELGKWRLYLRSLFWVVLMVFFTYTPILISFLMVGDSVDAVYFENQSRRISLFINIGLIVMVFFDYFNSNGQVHLKSEFVVLMLIGILLSIAIFFHSDVVYKNKLDRFVSPISWQGLSYLFHLLFLIILWILKERCYEVESEARSV